jgi:hypothetical protein
VRASDAELTVTVSANLRELFGGRAGPINAGEGPTALAPAVQVDLQLAPTALDLGAAPFDLFLFRAADLGHELHRTPYPGTALMHGALFNSHSDASRGGRWFVDARGLPFVLHLPVYALYPREGVDVARLWPRILGFAASGGAAEQDFYTGAAVLTEAYTGAPVPQPALLSPLPASDASCVGPQGLTQAFTPAQGCQAFVVPAGVTRLEAKAWGGGGGGAILNGGGHGGGGAFVQATLQVTPGESLLVCAGAGGALKTQDNWHGGGGGGLSGVFRGPYAQANALLIAAGGGGAVHCADGGAGGAPSGGKGRSCGGDLFGGGGGTPTAGGAAGGHISNTAPQAGRALLGGRGGDPEHSGYSSDVAGGGAAGAIGGGGGGGFFGGGGGGHHSGANGGAGGGGSSQAVDPAAVMAAGVAPEAGGALDPDHPAGVGRGGSGASRGEPGHVLLRW